MLNEGQGGVRTGENFNCFYMTIYVVDNWDIIGGAKQVHHVFWLLSGAFFVVQLIFFWSPFIKAEMAS